jgi:hypothetical protein
MESSEPKTATIASCGVDEQSKPSCYTGKNMSAVSRYRPAVEGNVDDQGSN